MILAALEFKAGPVEALLKPVANHDRFPSVRAAEGRAWSGRRSERSASARYAPSKGKKENDMALDQSVMRFAGFVVLLSLALGYVFSPYWLWLAGFAGANMIQASFTGFCPAAIVFKRLGVKSGIAFR
jgi:Protein of unknown function (DUF2892)